jgi:Fibronectin type III domain
MRSLAVIVAGAAVLALAGAAIGESRAGPPVVVVDGVSAGSFSVVVRWHVERGARVVVEYGVAHTDMQVWSPATLHGKVGAAETQLSSLEPGRTYSFRVDALSGSTSGAAEGSVTTTPMPLSVLGRTMADALVVNRQRFFPRMVFQQCPYAYPRSLAAGINLFMGANCTSVSGQLAALAGKALSVTPIEQRSVGGPGLVGWYQLDEADEHVDTPNALPLVPSSEPDGPCALPHAHQSLLRRLGAATAGARDVPGTDRAGRDDRL